MSWRIVSISSLCKLDYKMGYLVIRNRDTIKRVFLDEISILILESTAVSLTAYLLRELDRRKIDVVFCDEKRIPYGTLSSLYGSHDTALSYRKQMGWHEECKKEIWAEIVRRKIDGQIAVLPEDRSWERDLLFQYRDQVVSGDETNREGHAAKVYFNSLFGYSFLRSADTPINSALNYGYGLLLSAQAREITAAGYCTQLGIFHENRFNRLNLASDLMEPFRPYVDRMVYDIMPEKFERDEKHAMISVLNMQINLDGTKQYMLNALRIYTRSILDAIETGETDSIHFPVYKK